MGRRRGRGAEGSLACFIQALVGSRVVVELRGDTILRGTLASADEYMNLQLEGVTYTPLQGAPRALPALYVRARQVRFVHLPANLDPLAAVEAARRRAAEARRQHAAEQAAAGAARLQKGAQLELGGGGGGGGGEGGEGPGAEG